MKRQRESNQTTPDWMVDNYDSQTTETPCLEKEIRRLQVLKTFKLLDQPVQKCYERYTLLAARMLNTKGGLLSLVDLGRTFFAAHTGLGSSEASSSPTSPPREVPRKESFCAHAILCRNPVMVVTDAAIDDRFAETPLVKDYGVRFYAGAPLIAPSGDRIGCLSVFDDKPRPEGLSPSDKELLVELAASAMDLMLEKRATAQEERPQPRLSFPYDVQRATVQLSESLHQLKDDADFQTMASESHVHLLQSACTTADHLLSSVASRNITNQHKEEGDRGVAQLRSSLRSEDGLSDMDCQGDGGDSNSSLSNPVASSAYVPPNIENVGEQTTVLVAKLVQNLVSAMEVFPCKANLGFVVEPGVPKEIRCNDLKVFRSAIALLTSACERTEQGFVRFRIYKKDEPTRPMLVFECEDTGRDVALEQYHELFMIPRQEEIAQTNEEEECISVDPATGEVKRQAFCLIPKAPISEGVAVYPVARYVQVCWRESSFHATLVGTVSYSFFSVFDSDTVNGRRIWLSASYGTWQ